MRTYRSGRVAERGSGKVKSPTAHGADRSRTWPLPHLATWPLLLLALASCAAPYDDDRLGPLAVPPDFALQVSVSGKPQAESLIRQPAQYIVTVDRKLRAALGGGAGAGYFPPLTTRITPQQYEDLWRQVRDAGLRDMPSSDAAEQVLATGDELQLVCHVEVIAQGSPHRVAVLLGESAGVDKLVETLANLAGVTPPPAVPTTMPEKE
jgi:hypothetical protein